MKTYKISEQGIELIKSFEGYRAESYIDQAGKKTIGYGHVIKPNEILSNLTPEQAKTLLISDLRWVEKTINNTVICDLLQNEVDALGSLIFNIGGTEFRNSTLLKLLNQENYSDAADQFLRWVYAGGVVNQGLVNRRTKERELFLEES